MTTFDKVYAAVRLIPRGSVATYGQIAAAIGNKRLARVVGYALHVNQSRASSRVTASSSGTGGVKRFCFRRCEPSGRAFEGRRRRLLDDSHVDMKRCCVRALPLILEE